MAQVGTREESPAAHGGSVRAAFPPMAVRGGSAAQALLVAPGASWSPREPPGPPGSLLPALLGASAALAWVRAGSGVLCPQGGRAAVLYQRCGRGHAGSRLGLLHGECGQPWALALAAFVFSALGAEWGWGSRFAEWRSARCVPEEDGQRWRPGLAPVSEAEPELWEFPEVLL